MRNTLFTLVVLSMFSASSLAASPAEKIAAKPDAWFESDEGRRMMGTILSWQTEYGDWPKNMDTTTKPYAGEKRKPAGTFDNGATTGELRALARAVRVTGNDRYERAFLKGFDHILQAQYPNGGWPQYYPLSKGYHRHVTFNDGSMVRLMEFLGDATVKEDFAFLDTSRRAAATAAIDKGVECILRCQVIVDGVPTVWCAQHDADSLVPVKARSYEHPSLSGAESVGILLYLMSIESPDADVVRAVKAGVAWIESARIEGYRYRKKRTGPALVKDPQARPLWARFYEIETNRPIFSDRDGIVKYDLEQIGSERRGGYTWFGHWGDQAAEAYAKWPHR